MRLFLHFSPRYQTRLRTSSAHPLIPRRESPFSAFSPVPLQPLLSDPSPSKDFHPPIESVKSFFEEPPAFTAPSSLPSMLSPPLTPVLFQHPSVHPSTPLSPPPTAQPLHQEGPPLEEPRSPSPPLGSNLNNSLHSKVQSRLRDPALSINLQITSELHWCSQRKNQVYCEFRAHTSDPSYYNGESASHSSVPKRPLFPYLLRNVPGRQL